MGLVNHFHIAPLTLASTDCIIAACSLNTLQQAAR